jgi:diguanylate cyclase (GGDEF)-like protein/PAS domain S-box-containing protein
VDHPLSVVALTVAIATVGAVEVWLGRDLVSRGTPSTMEAIGFYCALTVASLLSLEYYVRGEVDAIDQFEAAIAPAIFFLPIPAAVALAAAAKASSQLLRGVHPLRACFNVAQWSAAVATGCLVFAAFSGPSHRAPADLGWLVLAMMAVAAVNAVCLLVVIALVQRPAAPGWLPRFTWSLVRDTSVGLVVNVVFGLLFITTYAWAPAVGPLLLVPLALLHWASRGYAVGRVEQSRLRVMQRATSALTASAVPEGGFAAFCGEIGRGFDREAVDLVLVGFPHPTVHSWRRDGSPAPTGSEPEAMLDAFADLDGPLLLRPSVEGSEIGHLLRSTTWSDCLLAPVTVAERNVGILCLYGARGAVAFAQREQQVVGALAQEAGLAVENASLVSQLIDEQQQLSEIVNGTQDGIATLGADGAVRAWNPAFERLTGFASRQMLGTPGLDLLRPVDAAQNRVSLARWPEMASDPPTELLVRTASSGVRWLSCSYARAYDVSGQVNRLIITARDVSNLKRAEALLGAQAVVLQLIAEGSPIAHSLGELTASVAAFCDGGRSAILLTDPARPDRLRLVASSSVDVDSLHAMGAFALTGRGSIIAAAVLEQRTMAILDAQADAAWPLLRSSVLALGIRSCWVLPIRASGAEPVLGALVVLRPQPPDTSEIAEWDALLERAARLAAIAVSRSEFETQLAYQASHDALTGLPNRAVFLDRCEQTFRRRRHTSGDAVVFFIDLDRFKLVNDSRGHEVGDRLLITVGQRLKSVIRAGDTVARLGGDEFAILCEDISDPLRVVELARRVQSVLAAPVPLPGGDVFIRASIGVAVRAGDVDVATLISNADAAMYRAKRLGGNRCEFYEEMMRAPAAMILSVQAELQRALDRNEFFVHYQPLVSLATGDVTGAEALLRWRHPQRGVLAPKDFLNLAESSGLIVPIGRQVMSLACHQARSWESAVPPGASLHVNINLSPLEFLQPELVQTVADALESSGVPPELIGLEITESAIMEDIDATASAMHELKELGVALIIDDFGTGYSSLTHLKRFPVDELKVDRSFVAGLCGSGKDGAIVNAVIALAHSLDLTAVAEGVETAAQRARLHDLGCDVGQGYYFGRPCPAGAMLARALNQPTAS